MNAIERVILVLAIVAVAAWFICSEIEKHKKGK